jgi:hypothetical protein
MRNKKRLLLALKIKLFVKYYLALPNCPPEILGNLASIHISPKQKASQKP